MATLRSRSGDAMQTNNQLGRRAGTFRKKDELGAAMRRTPARDRPHRHGAPSRQGEATMHATMQRRGEPGWSAAPAFRAGIPCTPIELNCDWHDNAGSGSGVPGYYVDTSPAGPAVVYFRGAVRQGPRRGPNPMLIGILPPDARPDRSVYELVHNFEDERRGAGEQRGLVGQEPIGGGRAQRVAGRVGHGPGVLRPSRNVFTIAHSYAGTYAD